MAEKFPEQSPIEKQPEEKPEAKTEAEIEAERETEAFENFGLKSENLKSIEGYESLSHGQRLLVAENLKQLTLGRIEEEAMAKYKQNTAEAKFLGRIWRGITKQYQITKLEKATKEDVVEGGMEVHGKVLENLVRGAQEYPPVLVGEDGKVRVLYAADFARRFGRETGEPLTAEQGEKLTQFNEITTEFSRIPDEWKYETASAKERERYGELKVKYENAKGEVLNLMEGRISEGETSLSMIEIENRLYLDQLMNTHPDVEKQLQKIDSGALRRALTNVVTERGIYATAGFITRSVTTSVIGAVGIPLAAAGMGGFMARRRALETLKEREVAARRGEKDVSKEAKNVVDAVNLQERLKYLHRRAQEEKNKEKREELLASLRTRVAFTQRKLEEGLVSFRGVEERLHNQYELITSLGHVGAYIEMFTEKEKTALDERLDQFLSFKEEKISKTQKGYVRGQVIRGAMIGAGFALGGYLIRHFAGEWFGWEKEVPVAVEREEIGVVPIEAEVVARTDEAARNIEAATRLYEAEVYGPPTPEPEVYSPLETEGDIETQMELATVGKGEGVEHALIRQLKPNAEAFGYKGDIDDTEALSDWAGKKAHEIAINQGYVKVEGGKIIEETRVGPVAKVAYILEREGDRAVVKEIDVASGIEVGESSTVETHEYVYRPEVVPEVPEAPKSLAEMYAAGEEMSKEEKVLLQQIKNYKGETELVGVYAKGAKEQAAEYLMKQIEKDSSILEKYPDLKKTIGEISPALVEATEVEVVEAATPAPEVEVEALVIEKPPVEEISPAEAVEEVPAEVTPEAEKVVPEAVPEKVIEEVPPEKKSGFLGRLFGGKEAVPEPGEAVPVELEAAIPSPEEAVPPITEEITKPFGEVLPASAPGHEGSIFEQVQTERPHPLMQGADVVLKKGSASEFVETIKGMTGDEIGQVPADTSQRIISEVGKYPPSSKFVLTRLPNNWGYIDAYDESGKWLRSITTEGNITVLPKKDIV